MRDAHRASTVTRRILSAAACSLLLVVAGAAQGAPGPYAHEALPTPHPAPVPNTGTQAIAFVNSLPLGVIQKIANTNTSANVPLCMSADDKRVGHAYAIKATSGAEAGTWVPHCYVEGTPLKGARIVKPSTTQAPNVKWVAMRKGQALPRLVVPVAYVEPNRIPVYACKETSSPTSETVGTLLPDGSCRLSKTLTSEARTVESSLILIHSATGNPEPKFGWISTARGFIPPGGTLLEWPSGGVYCMAGGAQGVLELNDASSSEPVGTVKGCRVTLAGSAGSGTTLSITSIRVFRNDAQSGVAFQNDVLVGGKSTRPEVATGATARPCFSGAPGFVIAAATSTGELCRTSSGDRPSFTLLRRVGTLPDEGG